MSQKALTLSIIIPAYNEENHLVACLDAIAQQTISPDQVVVVNNNSTDATVRIAQSYPFVTVINETQQGVLYARNAGFDAATTDLIGRIDADTVLPSTWVANVQELYAEYGAYTALTGPCRFVNMPFSRLTSRLHDLFYYRFSRLVTGHEVLFGSNMVISRATWQKARLELCQSHAVHEDTDLAVHIGQHTAIRREPVLRARATLRMPFTPLRLSRYVSRWLYTLGHLRSNRLYAESSSRN